MNFHNPNPVPLPKPLSPAEAAAVLGKKAKGVPKNFTEAERARRREQMENLNKRKPKKAHHDRNIDDGENRNP